MQIRGWLSELTVCAALLCAAIPPRHWRTIYTVEFWCQPNSGIRVDKCQFRNARRNSDIQTLRKFFQDILIFSKPKTVPFFRAAWATTAPLCLSVCACYLCKVGFPPGHRPPPSHGARRRLQARRRGELFLYGELPHLTSLICPPYNPEFHCLPLHLRCQRELFARHLAAAAASPWTAPPRLPEPGKSLFFFMLFECIDRVGLCCLSVNWTGRERRSPGWWCPSRSFHG